MQANFELKYVKISWYDQSTVLTFEESLFPLKLDFDEVTGRFICNTLIYPEHTGVNLGQLAFRSFIKDVSIPYFEATDGARFSLKKVIDRETGNEWWVEANFWDSKYKTWESKTHRYAGKSVVVLHSQMCQINIGSSEFTAEQLELYLTDFKSDLWELILDEGSYITGDVKNNKAGGVSLHSIEIVSNALTHAQHILDNPKSELREIQALKPRKLVKPVNRTFMEIATRGDNRFLTSRAYDATYDIAENRYVLFALERINKILTQQIKVSKKKSARSIDSIKKLDERLKSFSSSKLISKELVRNDLEKIKRSYDLEHLNRSLLDRVTINFSKDLSDINLETWFVKIDGKEQGRKGYSAGIRQSESADWFSSKTQATFVFLRFANERFSELFKIGFEYKIEAEIKYEEEFSEYRGGSHCYTIIGLNSIKKIGGEQLDGYSGPS